MYAYVCAIVSERDAKENPVSGVFKPSTVLTLGDTIRCCSENKDLCAAEMMEENRVSLFLCCVCLSSA